MKSRTMRYRITALAFLYATMTAMGLVAQWALGDYAVAAIVPVAVIATLIFIISVDS